MRSIYFAIFCLFASITARAQKTVPKKVGAHVVKKAASAAPGISLKQISASIAKLHAMILDPGVAGSDLAGKFLYATPDSHAFFSPAYQVAGAEHCYAEKFLVSRNSYAQTGWIYHCLMAKIPGGSDSSMLEKMRSVLDSSLAGISNCDSYINCIEETKLIYSRGNILADSVGFTIKYYKRTEGTPVVLMDSIIRLYRPGLIRNATFNSAFGQFNSAAIFEGLMNIEATIPALTELTKAIYLSNPDNAFDFVMHVDLSSESLTAIMQNLDPSIRQDLRTRATKVVDDYKRSQDSTYYAVNYPNSVNPYTARTAAENNGATRNGSVNICAENQSQQQFTVGSELKTDNYGGNTYFVTRFDCYSNKYEILQMTPVSSRKTFFKSDANVAHNECTRYTITAADLAARYRSAGSSKKLCPSCGGSGCTTVTQVRTTGGWQWENFNVTSYSDPRVVAQWNERQTCTRCYGLGYIN